MSRYLVLLLCFVALPPLVRPLASADPKPMRQPNRLAKESSPYLLQHAHNPVDWFPWGQEAFAKARKEKKLVFLSIGYSACHWCHVMERESFANEAIAKILNENFVCVKVDREERPDIDEIYMAALNATGLSGGWPLTMFLTAEGKPIFGGTYFPPEDKKVEDGTITGMKSILKRVIELNSKEGPALEAQADRIARMTVETLGRGTAVPLAALDRDMVADVVRWFEFDPVHGGLGDKLRQFRGTKFPRAAAIGFLLQQSRQPGNERLAKSVTLTLQKMAEGGIYDQLGGGFHRYSTERTWTVPHFEKMLYDNAQLVELYADAYRSSPDPLYQRIVAETHTFLAREMTSPTGVFYSALDADSNGVEGEYYVWTLDELTKVLASDADLQFVQSVYGVSEPNFEGKFHILRLSKSTIELAKELKMNEADLLAKLEPLKAKLLAYRSKRERPFLDQKVIVSWNGQMIAGYARAGEVFKNDSYIAAATKAARFILDRMRTKDGRLLRLFAAVPGEQPIARGNAFLDDYAFLLHGLLNLHDATGNQQWLDDAQTIAKLMIRWYGDTEHGGFFFTAHDHEKLFARSKDSYDGAQPSGNGMAARSLLRLWRKTGDTAYRDECLRTVRYFASAMKSSPGSMTSLARCLDELLTLAASDPTILAMKDGPKPVAKAPREAADVVSATVRFEKPDPKGKQTFTVTLTVAEPWHIYANPVGNESLKDSETTIEVFVGGQKIESTIDYPAGLPAKDVGNGGYQIYTGAVKFSGTVQRTKDDGEIEVRLRVLACKDRLCLLPSTIKLK